MSQNRTPESSTHSLNTFCGLSCIGAEIAANSEVTRKLREALKRTDRFAMEVSPPSAAAKKKALLEKQRSLFALAREMGFCLEKTCYYESELSSAVAKRLQTRRGQHIYQNTSFRLPGFPRHAAESMFPAALLQAQEQSTNKSLTWVATTVKEVRELFGELLMQHKQGFTTGLSRGLCTQSETCIRVLATIMPPVQISWSRMACGLHRLYVNMIYLLCDENGDLHKPKDMNRREMTISPAQELAYRAMILQDAQAMEEAGMPLSPGFLRQMGKFVKAQAMEAQLDALAYPPYEEPQPEIRTRRVRAPRLARYEIDRIVEEKMHRRSAWFLVRWAGYQPAWEAWRVHGAIGSPVETWEPFRMVKNTEALEAWQNRAY